MKADLFAVVFAALYAGHQVGDFWVQTYWQASAKAARGWPGRLACGRHVATHTATIAVALGTAAAVTGIRLHVLPSLAGVLVNAVSHYAADRRVPLKVLASLLDRATGKSAFYQLGAPRDGRDDNPTLGTGAFHLDQSWHVGWLFIAALIIVA